MIRTSPLSPGPCPVFRWDASDSSTYRLFTFPAPLRWSGAMVYVRPSDMEGPFLGWIRAIQTRIVDGDVFIIVERER